MLLFLLWLIIEEPLSAWGVNTFKNTITIRIIAGFLSLLKEKWCIMEAYDSHQSCDFEKVFPL